MGDIETHGALPSNFQQGDSLSVLETQSDFQGGTWELNYVLTHEKSGAVHKITSTNSSGQHSFTVTPADTSKWDGGRYSVDKFVRRLSDGAQRTLASGIAFQVRPTGGKTGGPGFNQRMLAAVEGLLEGRLTKEQGIDQLSQGGIDVTRIDAVTLLELRNKFTIGAQRERDAERIAKGWGSSAKIGIRFK